jgi:hypothetical protein
MDEKFMGGSNKTQASGIFMGMLYLFWLFYGIFISWNLEGF